MNEESVSEKERERERERDGGENMWDKQFAGNFRKRYNC